MNDGEPVFGKEPLVVKKLNISRVRKVDGIGGAIEPVLEKESLVIQKLYISGAKEVDSLGGLVGKNIQHHRNFLKLGVYLVIALIMVCKKLERLNQMINILKILSLDMVREKLIARMEFLI